MTILVTGATGHVGRHLVDQLLEAGQPVRALTRDPAAASLPAAVDVVAGDLAQPRTLQPALHGVTALHLITIRASGTTGAAGGWARRRGRAGTVVVGIAETAKDRLTSIRRTGRIYAPDEHAKITSAELAPAPDDIAGALGIAPGELTIHRYRVTYQGGRPVSASTSWYDDALARTAPLLLVAERLKQGTPRYIEERTGRTVTTGRDHVGARLATAEDAEALGIELGAPVLHGQNWFYDAEGGVIEYGQYRSAGERLRSYEYRVED